jgi:hypothetical protein
MSSVHCFATCPSVQLINSLVTTSTQTVSSNKSDICECTQIQEGGWEITCFNSNSNTNSETSQPEFADDFNIIPLAFFIRYEIGRQVKITCDSGVPLWRPALFQGFGIESIDSFSFVNCVLPQSLPLSVILHRTSSIKAINFTSKNNSESTASNQNYKAFNEAPEISKVRSLAITSKESVSVEQLNILLMSLESLEQLKLSQFKLNDIVNLTATALFDKSEELINVNNETKHFNTSEKTRLVLDENILNFGQSFPNLKVLRLQSFINELVPGLLFDMLNGLTKLEYLELDSNNLASLPEKSF